MATDVIAARACAGWACLAGRRVRKSARARGGRLAAALALAAPWLGSGIALSSPAAAANVCGDHRAILKRLEERHEETRQALGLSSDGAVFEVLVAPDGGWTMLVTYPEQSTCIVAVGEAWEMLKLAGGDGA